MKEDFFKKVVEKIGTNNLNVNGLVAILGFAAEHTTIENIFESLINGPSNIDVDYNVLNYYLEHYSYSKHNECNAQSYKICGVRKIISVDYTYLGTVYAKEEGNTIDTNGWETSTYKYPVTALKNSNIVISFDDYEEYKKKYAIFILQNQMNDCANDKNDATPVEE